MYWTSYPQYSEGTSNSVTCPKLVVRISLLRKKRKSQMNTLACGSFPLLLPLSCHSVTSSANFFLSFLLFFWLDPLPACPSFYSFPSIPPHRILLFIIFLLNLKMASSYLGSPLWVFLGMACHLSGHTPSGDVLWRTLSMDATSQACGCLPLTP